MGGASVATITTSDYDRGAKTEREMSVETTCVASTIDPEVRATVERRMKSELILLQKRFALD